MSEAEPTPTPILVVANETLVGDELVDAVKRRAARGPIRVVVVAPVTQPREGYVVYRDSRRAAAGRRLDRTLAALREAGIPAHGGVFDDDPLTAVKDVLAAEEIDEIIVSTHPETKSGWLRKNLVEEIRRVAGDRPVEHVVVDAAAKPARTSSSSRTRPSSGSRCSTASARGPRRARRASSSSAPRATRRAPSIPRPSGACGSRSRRCAARASTSTARSRTPTRSPPRCRRSTTSASDEIIVSTFPGERSGWLRRDLVGRLRSESGLPVEHVVVGARARGGRARDRARRGVARPPRARPRRTRARASTRACSGCSSSSPRRRCSSARSSRPTSSSAS